MSTLTALALDVRTQRKSTRRGIYVLPEDDKDAQKLNDLKSIRARSEGYEAPAEQEDNAAEMRFEQEQDIGYHNRYGVEQETHGPLEGDTRDTGYKGKVFEA